MKSNLFEHLKGKTPKFNPELFDIPTGQYLNGGIQRGEFTTYVAHPRKTGPNYTLISRLFDELEKLEPATPARWAVATKLLCYMGYSLTTNGEDQCPTVHWINTEGNGDAEAQMIDDIFNRDYNKNPRLDLSAMSNQEMVARMREAYTGGSPIVMIDSISQESTHPS